MHVSDDRRASPKREKGTAYVRFGAGFVLTVGMLVCALILGADGGTLRFGDLTIAGEAAALPPDQGEAEPVTPRVGFVPSVGRAYPKLDTPLTELVRTARTSPGQIDAVAQAHALRIDANLVQVQLTVAPGAEATVSGAVSGSGGEVTGHYLNTLQAWLPLNQVMVLQERADVFRIQTPPQLIELEIWDRRLSRTSSPAVVSEGLAALNGDTWHLGEHSGEGVKIAVIDGSFGGFDALLGSELPSTVMVNSFVDGETAADVGTSSSNHGTACAEIVHDVAPSADIYLIKVSTDVDLAEAVDYVIAEGVNIISTSIGWTGVTPNDGSGFFADLVALARDATILWVTAAGNFGETHWSGTFVDFGDGSHQFGPDQNLNPFSDEGSAECHTFSAEYPLNMVLQWNDWTTVDQDFDLHLYYKDGESWRLVASSTNTQNGGFGQKPVERIVLAAPDTGCYGVLILRYDATRDVHFDLFAYDMKGLHVREPSRSLTNLADSPMALTVGAVHHTSPYVLESFSSRGPTNGPGGSPTGGFTKPDLAAYDGVSTASRGTASFFGTSAAAPHVAGAVALVKSAKPEWDLDEMQQFLAEAAVDQGSPGTDNEYGAGRLWLDNLLSLELVNWPTLVAAGQAPTVTWTIELGGVADTYVGWGPYSTSGSPPIYDYQTGIYTDARSGVFSSGGEIFLPGVDRYYFRAYIQDADGSLWTEEQSVSVDPHEPEDDRWQTAYELTVPISDVQSYARSEGDVDWYSFEITQPGTVYTVTVTPPSGLDLDVALFSPIVTPTQEELGAAMDLMAIADLAPSDKPGAIADLVTVSDLIAFSDLPAADLVAVSAQPGSQAEQVSHRVWFDEGPQRVVVFGYNGAHNTERPYQMQVEMDTSQAWAPTPVDLPNYRPPVSPTVKTVFVTNWKRINGAYGISASEAITAALNEILHDSKVLGTVIDLSSLDTVTNTDIISRAYDMWDDDPANPYLASRVGLVVQDVISDAIHNSYPATQYIVVIGDDQVVPFLRLPDRTAIGNEVFYRDVSGSRAGTASHGALDGRFYLTDDCYADSEPLAWPGGRLCVPDYPIGRLVESPDEIARAITAFSDGSGAINVRNSLVTGYDFLTDQATTISSTLGAQVTVTALISDTWTAADLERLWISDTHDLHTINGHFDHFRVLPADPSTGSLTAGQIGDSVWDRSVLGFSMGCHSGFSAHDSDFDQHARDLAQTMIEQGAVWIGDTGCAVGDGSNVSYAEDLAVRLAGHLADGIARDGVSVGAALVRAKQDYISEAPPSSLDLYDRKTLMVASLYGLPHWVIGNNELATVAGQSSQHGLPEQVSPVSDLGAPVSAHSALVTNTRDITLTLTYALQPGNSGQLVSATVEGVSDSMGILTATESIVLRQQSNFGRPQLPIVSFNAAYTATVVPHGVVFVGGRAKEYVLDPIITRVVTDQLYPSFAEPRYEFEQWFPTQPVKLNRLGSRVAAVGNKGQLVFYPNQIRAIDAEQGTLRAFEEVRLRIYYEEVGQALDWQAPVIRRVKAWPQGGQVAITIKAADPDPGTGGVTGVAEVLVLYSTDERNWRSVRAAHDGVVWNVTIDLPIGGTADQLSFVVQAVDAAGNAAYSADKGRYYRGAERPLYLPLVLMNDH